MCIDIYIHIPILIHTQTHFILYSCCPYYNIFTFFSQVALLDNEDMSAVDGDDDWQFVSIGEQQNFGIRTAGLEEKATACQMLVCYARELKDGFADYTEQVSVILHVEHLEVVSTVPLNSPKKMWDEVLEKDIKWISWQTSST